MLVSRHRLRATQQPGGLFLRRGEQMSEEDRVLLQAAARVVLFDDAEIAGMTRWFEDHTIARFGRYHQVEPTVVVMTSPMWPWRAK